MVSDSIKCPTLSRTDNYVTEWPWFKLHDFFNPIDTTSFSPHEILHLGRSAQLQITHYTTHTVNQQKNFQYFWWLIDVSNNYLANQRFLGRSSQNVVKIELKRTSWSGLDLCKRWPGSVRIHTSCRATPPSRVFILIPRGKK